jgi:hypothetical protein
MTIVFYTDVATLQEGKVGPPTRVVCTECGKELKLCTNLSHNHLSCEKCDCAER